MATGEQSVGRLPRLPQLDGLRAVAVLLVIGAHLAFSISMSTTTRKALSPLIGNDGVTLFFILSGYLITSLLVREQVLTGSIRLRTFAARRALRIAPAFMVYMAVAAILVAAGKLNISWLHLLLATLYLWDYVPATVRWLGHTWSLAVEEQFYLLWPATLLLLRTRWALRLALAVVVAGPIIRWYTLRTWPADSARLGFMAHEHVDALLIGAALAILPVAAPSAYRRFTEVALRSYLDVLAVVTYFIAAPYLVLANNHAFDSYFFDSLLAVSGALVIHGLIERPTGATARLLGHRVPRHIGIASYSLYLWQQPWLIPTHSMSPILRLVGAFACAETSLWLVEKPFLRLKSRLSSPGADPTSAVAAPEVAARTDATASAQ